MRRRLALLALLTSTTTTALIASCSGDEGAAATSGAAGTSTSSGEGGSSSATGTGGSGGDLIIDPDGGGDCVTDGASCGDAGGICAGGVCCDAEKACGASCCGSGDVCSFQLCVTPGDICVDATDCPDDYYCEYALGDPTDAGAPDASCQGGTSQETGKCLPKPPECPPGVTPGPNDPITCLPQCEYKPPIGQFTPTQKYQWGDPAAPSTADSVMMAPVVIQLDDDTCDGVIDERDIPEIVFSTFKGGNYNGDGTLHAISIVDQTVVNKWSVNEAVSPIHPGRSIAAGNIDGIPGNEVVVCTTDFRVRAYDGSGNLLWMSPASTSCFMPSIADLDQDGNVEVIVESQILDGKTGVPVAIMNPVNANNVVVSDIDGDGFLDIVTPTSAYHADGNVFVDTGLVGLYPAIGDLDKDGVPEVVVANKATHELMIWHYDPNLPGSYAILRQHIDINGPLSPSLCPVGSSGNKSGGGPPTVADFNGDGFPDVALAGGVGYAVFDGVKLMDPLIPDDQTILWITQTQDCSSAATGSSVFDFDGDGKAEVVYADEVKLHVYAGSDGTPLWETCNTSGTLFEYPLVADVDNDGQADIVVASNSYATSISCPNSVKTAGIRVFGDANGNWVRTRRVWNQHPYHVTNIEEDGTVPTIEAPNYSSAKLNNFRQNVQPLGEFSAPDLVVSVGPQCGVSYALVATVRNIGEAAAPAQIPVGFYEGDPAQGGVLLGTGLTSKTLYSAEAVQVVLDLPNPSAGVLDGSTPLYAVVDDGATPHTWHECRTDNNTSEAVSGKCDGGPN